ncbi:winged helix-turn-helix transcriptional regulator [Solirhodobacter olei]|uniref:winged helix-turn-helix transcriptional regulator n=1 Tax=Solirhodobacter olei TaxID=2493082 RepID=UPI001F4E5105|nr:helix-turn-helix domain-containing protein [Solirhodobacter olei]
MKPDVRDQTASCQTISAMLSRIGDKWSALVVTYLGQGPMRFSALRREIGNISQKMLTTTLRNLERDGLVARVVTPSRPPRVDYALTDLGRELLGPIDTLVRWTVENTARINAARARYDAENGG